MAMIETLEAREFLSVSTGSVAPTVAAISAQISAAVRGYPNIIGTYNGSFADKGHWKGPWALGMKITSQSGTNISGRLFDDEGGVLLFTGKVGSDRTVSIHTYGNHNKYNLYGRFDTTGKHFTGHTTGILEGFASYGNVTMSKTA